jgi:hypothetical protein
VSDDALERIRPARILPIVGTQDPREAAALVERIVAGGLTVIELTTTIAELTTTIAGWEPPRPTPSMPRRTSVSARDHLRDVEPAADGRLRRKRVPTIAQLADERYQRKDRKGLRANSLADMKRKLEIHLLPHFGHVTVSDLTSRDVEVYLDHKPAENAGSRPRLQSASRCRRPWARDAAAASADDQLAPAPAELLARAVREGLLARNPAEGEDLRSRSAERRSTASSSTRRRRSWRPPARSTSAPPRTTSYAAGS